MSLFTQENTIPSLKLTWPLKIGLPNRKVVFQPSIFRGYVSFREGNYTGCIWMLHLFANSSIIFSTLWDANQFKHNYSSIHILFIRQSALHLSSFAKFKINTTAGRGWMDLCAVEPCPIRTTPVLRVPWSEKNMSCEILRFVAELIRDSFGKIKQNKCSKAIFCFE